MLVADAVAHDEQVEERLADHADDARPLPHGYSLISRSQIA